MAENDIFLAALGVIALLIMIFCCLLSKIGGGHYRSLKLSRKSKLTKTTNLRLEAKVLNVMKNGTDLQFDNFFDDIKDRINYKYYTSGKALWNTRMKRSIYNVINKNTNSLPLSRIKRIADIFPLLKRVYFGPKLTKEVYSAEKKKKFKFKIKEGEEIPNLNSIIDLALFLDTTVNVVLGYCYTQDPGNKTYYIKKGRKKRNLEYKSRFYRRRFITKRDGRKRMISAPRFLLKSMQRMILHEILEKAELDDCCTGFVTNKSIVNNAQAHLGANLIVKMDFHRFFPSLKFYHIMEVFRGFGYSRSISGALACICSDFYNSGRFAPQGAPTSPMIGNLYASRLDKRLKGLWEKHNFVYTRYADDLTFSSNKIDQKVGNFIYATYEIIKDEELQPNFQKTKIYRKGNRLEVTGIVINEKLNINRKWMNNLRAELHNYFKDGFRPETEIEDRIRLLGKISFLNMVDPKKAEKFKTKYYQITSNTKI